ncbi:TfoX N-terminal domain-containing protein [Reichenbachiella faecimaris]|uniref:TfoX N-terminal domain-containing protein n=1 Tax=Reichenbachiella faecimaris TaxID=692418 RepID=A0A1W2GDP0_REIFA|nr:TfoX/Sxy family protein [Reichenbachiella faecimaris]SMD34779.1 TfoX N-terminal domain-containing protein [Reichenbachiella faecimaris]
MAYNQELATRLRQHLEPYGAKITEKRMFGGLCYLYQGKMCVGIVKEDLCVRIISPKDQEELKKEYVRPMDFTGKALKEFVYVSADGFQSETDLAHWVNLGIEHAESKL